jgi:ABC-2 type transport system ATP-binding protein
MYIEVNHISKTYGDQKVIKDVTVSFEKGKIHGIVGRNGSGKTVLFKCICGYVKPETGEVLLDGKQIGKAMDYPPSLGLILEAPGFLPNFSGLFNLEMLQGINHKVDASYLRGVMQQVKLQNVGKKPVGKYSMGMRQRLGIAQAIMEDPELLILDEPFNGLDAQGVEDIRQLFLSLREKGKTILLTSHYTQDIEALCDTVHEMDSGVITSIR